MDENDDDDKLKTLNVKQRKGEIVKPNEIIGMSGMEGWTLAERRVWNLLIENAWASNMEDPKAEFTIALSELRGLHGSNDRTRDIIRTLQKTLVTVKMPNGAARTVQMLGATDIFDSDRKEGIMKYDFHHKLVPVLRDSEIYTRLDVKIASSFTSKYGLALYEIISSKINLDMRSEIIDVETARRWLGVEPGKLNSWGDLRKYAIEPAMLEVNKLSLFMTRYDVARKIRKKVTHIEIFWGRKKPLTPAETESITEVNRVKMGRKARIRGNVENIITDNDIVLSDSDIQKGYDAAAPICRIDKHMAYNDWRNYVSRLPERPGNLVGHFISFCKKRANEVKP